MQNFKKAALVALVALILLVIGAAIFYKERMLFADAPYIAFNIINNNSLAIQVGRYGSFVTQLVPYIGGILHLPTSSILLAYSLSFNLFYLLVFLVLAYGFKQPRMAILMALYYFLFISDCYFWTNNEIHQAIAWMFLFIGSICYLGARQVSRWLVSIVFCALSFITLSTHFVVIIPAFFLLGYLVLEKDQWPFSRTYTGVLITLILGVVALKYSIASAHPYEAEHLQHINHVSIRSALHGLNSPVIRLFLHRCVTNYWVAIPVFFGGVLTLMRTGRHSLAIWVIVSTFGYFLIMGITYADLDKATPLYHIESEWASIAIVVATPFVFAFLPTLKPNWLVGILACIFLVRSLYICSAISSFTWRTAFQEKVITKMREKNLYKLAIYNNEKIQKKYMLDWALPYESMLLSSCWHERPQRTFCFVNKDDTQALTRLKTTNALYETWGMLPTANLNHYYFQIDTTSPYAVMTYEELFSR